MQALVNEAIEYAKHDGDSNWDLTVDARELVDPLLADFCEEWFGLSPDGGYFRRSGYRWDWQQGQPPNYPGHFLSPSRYIFQPHPGPEVKSIGEAHGAATQTAMLDFLNRFGPTITAPVARAVLDSPPGNADPAFAARTIVGGVIGFVPTVDGNVLRILNEWLREGNLWSLRARLGGTEAADFTEACSRLGDDFIPAMQLRAAPDLLWRTATASLTLGEGQHQVAVNPGDIVVAAAISATQQNLEEGRTDLHNAFGGNRKAKSHPTHACPGADPALAVMIGFFSALVETPLPLRVGPGPLTIALDGRLPPPDAAFKAKRQATISIDPAYNSKFAAGEKLRLDAVATPLMAIGDSWLFDQWDRDYGVTRPNLVKSLRALGYKDIASDTTDFAYAGRALSDMAQPSFLRDVTNYIADQPDIKALLVGGGGNDVVSGFQGQQPLFKMLRPLSAGAPALIEAEVASFIDGTLFNYYDTILKTLTASTNVPIILHAYDHPIPDGRGDTILGFSIGPWLNPYFLASGYQIAAFPSGLPDLNLAKEVMKQLIDRLNAMVTRVATAYPNVHHVNLTGTLAKAYGDDYARLWNNELHPKGDGYDLVAKLIEARLKSLGI